MARHSPIMASANVGGMGWSGADMGALGKEIGKEMRIRMVESCDLEGRLCVERTLETLSWTDWAGACSGRLRETSNSYHVGNYREVYPQTCPPCPQEE